MREFADAVPSLSRVPSFLPAPRNQNISTRSSNALYLLVDIYQRSPFVLCLIWLGSFPSSMAYGQRDRRRLRETFRSFPRWAHVVVWVFFQRKLKAFISSWNHFILNSANPRPVYVCLHVLCISCVKHILRSCPCNYMFVEHFGIGRLIRNALPYNQEQKCGLARALLGWVRLKLRIFYDLEWCWRSCCFRAALSVWTILRKSEFLMGHPFLSR